MTTAPGTDSAAPTRPMPPSSPSKLTMPAWGCARLARQMGEDAGAGGSSASLTETVRR
jgi:hypothetical protein